MNDQKSCRLRRIAGACLVAMMLCGCTQTPPTPSTETPTPSTGSVTDPTVTDPIGSLPSETEPPITEPPLDEIPETLDPVTKLACTRWVTFPDLLSLGDGIVLASRSYFDRQAGSYVNSMEVVDVYADTILHQIVNDGTRELVLQRFDDGKIVTADPKGLEFYVYDRTLTLLDSFCAPSVDGWFSYDRENYYYVDSGVLFRMDVASGNRGRMELGEDLRLESLVGIHPTEDLLVARVYLSAYTDNCGLAVIDARSGKLRLLSDKLSHLWFTGDSFYGVSMNADVYGCDVYMGTLSGTEVTRLTTDQIGDDQMGYSVLPGSHLLVRRYAPDDEPRNTTIFDLRSCTTVDLDDYGYIDCTFGAIWLYEEQLIMGFYEDGDYFYPVLLDPKAMDFEEGPTPQSVGWPELVDPSVIDRYLATVDGPTLDDPLSEVRARADAIEEAYHVTIQIAQQTQLACKHSYRSAQTVTDAAAISTALEELEAVLARYPKDFFKKFQNGAREGGVTFCLTGPIEGDLPTVGFAELIRDTYILGLDITAGGLDRTIHHEIWHAIEMRISTDTFDTDAWSECNPSGFKYYGKYDTGYLDLTKWTWSNGSGSASCFVDPYSRINAREDRARIWEMVMSTDAAALMEADALRQKLQIMSDAIGDTFQTDSASHWAQYL